MIAFKFTSLLCLLCWFPAAHAYIDPGSGSFMLQMLIASLIGASLTIKTYFKILKAKVKKVLFSVKKKSLQNNVSSLSK